MKQIQKTISISILALILTGVVFLGGCQNDSVDLATQTEVNNTSRVPKLYSVDSDPAIKAEVEWLAREGFLDPKEYQRYMTEGVIFIGNTLDEQGYGYQTDLFISRKEVQKEMKTALLNRGARHRKFANLYSGGTVYVRIHPNVPIAWNAAVKQACIEWNNLGYNLNFIAYDASNTIQYNGEIDVVYENIGYPSAYARAIRPASSGVIGEKLSINSNFSGIPASSLSERKFVLAHEMGHNIGIAHTDVPTNSEVFDVSSYISCNGNQNYTDSQSVMRNGIIAGSTWPGFSTCDRVVLNYYW